MEPAAPELAGSYPTGITITPVDAAYYRDVCDRYSDPEEDPAAVYAETRLSRAAACEWAITGFTAQGIFNLETIFNQIADYAERMRADRKLLVDMLNDYYEMSDNAQKEIKEKLEAEPPKREKFLGIF